MRDLIETLAAPFTARHSEGVLAQARIHGDDLKGYFWMAPAGVAVCNFCGWELRGLSIPLDGSPCPHRLFLSAPQAGKGRQRYGEGPSPTKYSWAVRPDPDPPFGLKEGQTTALCNGRMNLAYYFVERFNLALIDGYRLALRWAESGCEPADKTGSDAWRLYFTFQGALKRRPENVLAQRGELPAVPY